MFSLPAGKTRSLDLREREEKDPTNSIYLKLVSNELKREMRESSNVAEIRLCESMGIKSNSWN